MQSLQCTAFNVVELIDQCQWHRADVEVDFPGFINMSTRMRPASHSSHRTAKTNSNCQNSSLPSHVRVVRQELGRSVSRRREGSLYLSRVTLVVTKLARATHHFESTRSQTLVHDFVRRAFAFESLVRIGGIRFGCRTLLRFLCWRRCRQSTPQPAIAMSTNDPGSGTAVITVETPEEVVLVVRELKSPPTESE